VQYAPFVRELSAEKPVRLTRAQVETLAIVAYRQPVTRPEIDDIRGVDSGATLKLLLERDLVRILGKKDEPGRPMLYGTTGQFLEFFGLKSLKDLPTLKEFTELTDESRRIAESELGDVLAEPGTEPGMHSPTLTPEPVHHDTVAPIDPVDPPAPAPLPLDDSD
jgi:segregation and condensation protein B